MASKIRCNDHIIVITGKYKGKTGIVKHITSNNRAIVEGINLVKKHQKPVSSIKKPGNILEKEAAIDLSNLAILNSATNKADRVGFKIENNKKVRFLKSNGEIIK